MYGEAGEYYEPDEEEKREIEELLNNEDKLRDNNRPLVKNRLTFVFNSESHWAGWLKVNGIKW